MTPRPRLLLVSGALSFALACGGPAAGGGATADHASARPRPISRAALAKLDEALRERLDQDSVFPVLVKFTSRPSRDELAALLLVAYEHDAIGRVDRPTLEAIAERSDVEHVSLVDAGYTDDDAAGTEDAPDDDSFD